MLTVNAAFTAEARDKTRNVTSSLQVSWKKQYLSTYRAFTIGVSTIGGADTIATDGGLTSDWNKYIYENESAYLMYLAYERELSQPTGGMSKALAEVGLDNTSGRFTPRYAGGTSAIFTSVYKPRRPMIINSGFRVNGVDTNIPQFVGITNKTPEIDNRSRTAKLQAVDFIDYLQNRYVDTAAVFTSQRTDTIIASSLATLGFSTAQYDLDYGINTVSFAEIEPGDKWGNFIQKLVEAENGIFWQDEKGILRFQNRQAWDSSPYNAVQAIVFTGQVIEARTPSTDHIINVVEVKSAPRAKQPDQLVWKLATPITLNASGNTEFWVNFDDPMLAIDAPVFVANTVNDDTGTDVTTSVSIKSSSKFVRSAKYTFYNSTGSTAYITAMTVYGRPAKVTTEIYYREKRDASVTAYEERPYLIENEYIGNASWAASYAGMTLNDYATPENLQELTIRALPQLQLGDLVSWQGRYWRIYSIKTKLDPGSGFIQELTMLQRTITTYFRIGISTVGGSDKIAP